MVDAMSLRIDFSEIAATQFFLLPHDVYGALRTELIALVLADAPLGKNVVVTLEEGGFVFQVKCEVDRARTYVRVLTIQKVKTGQSAA